MKRYLNRLIKNVATLEFKLNEINENLGDNNNYLDNSEEANVNDISWFQWSANIYENAQQLAINCTERTAINACYNPDFAKTLKTYLMPYVVLWSGIMRSYFDIGDEIATSSSVEAAFADIKKRAFKGQLPMRADRFVKEHLDYIDSRIKLTSNQSDIVVETSLKEFNEQQNQVEHNNSSSFEEIQGNNSLNDCCHLGPINSDMMHNGSKESVIIDCNINNEDQINSNICENWRGFAHESPEMQCVASKQRRKPSYLDKCPEWEYIKSTRNQSIPLIRNGNVSKSIIINEKVINVHQTCAFDAILHLVASSISTIKCYEQNIKLSSNRTVHLAFSILQNGKITQQHYKERANILLHLPLFRDAITTYTRQISKLNTTCNVSHLLSYLFTDIPSCKITTNCPCTSSKTRQLVELNINIDILLCKGLQYMQDAINDTLAITPKCRKCFERVEENYEYGPHLFIDTTIFSDNRYTKRNTTITNSLSTIATTIELKSTKYILTGLINYENLSDNASSGHYITYSRCGPHWYEYDDLKKKGD